MMIPLLGYSASREAPRDYSFAPGQMAAVQSTFYPLKQHVKTKGAKLYANFAPSATNNRSMRKLFNQVTVKRHPEIRNDN